MNPEHPVFSSVHYLGPGLSYQSYLAQQQEQQQQQQEEYVANQEDLMRIFEENNIERHIALKMIDLLRSLTVYSVDDLGKEGLEEKINSATMHPKDREVLLNIVKDYTTSSSSDTEPPPSSDTEPSSSSDTEPSSSSDTGPSPSSDGGGKRKRKYKKHKSKKRRKSKSKKRRKSKSKKYKIKTRRKRR